ncbi:hypothetical protein F5Y10DRAFT_253746 [Nemania abortiva]|nr:hypothetical protein F5Y10DRAFT_253746 [Nemania abortiva]
MSSTTEGTCREFWENVKSEIPIYPDNSIFSLVRLYQDLARNIDVGCNVADTPKVTVSPRRTRAMARLENERNVTRQLQHLSLEDQPRTPAPAPAQRGMIITPSTSSTQGPEGSSPGDPLLLTAGLPTTDEMVVNMALVTFLSALCERDDSMRMKGYQWLPDRNVFKILHPETGEKLLEARTDGCLRSRAIPKQHYSAAIIEVKPYLRLEDFRSIQRQEGAQMAAHISVLARQGMDNRGLLRSPAPDLKRRLIISQDHEEVYITIAEYDNEYQQFISGRSQLTSRPPAAAAGLSTPSKPPRTGTRSTSITTTGNTGGLPVPVTPRRPIKPTRRRGRNKESTMANFLRDKTGAQANTASGLKSSRGTEEGFLVMSSYGPWSMRSSRDLQYLCRDLMALSLYLSREKIN